MISAEGIIVSYGGTPVLRNCSLHVSAGERVLLTGPSGCGKTTFLRVLAGLVKPEAGYVRLGGKAAMVFQEPRLFPWLTAERNLALVTARPRDWLERVGLAEAAGKYPSELSGGMRQRLNICRALAAEGEILLLDEPFKGLDGPLRREIAALTAEYAAGRAAVLVSHDAEDRAMADTIYEYHAGGFRRA
ncbi:MAG: ABC transporter ATP-binding protein [Oscillospiraceae bacterium]|nr:ABC transporter ATP-binding protein [Oscillospiraceae bacterium]